MIVASRDFRKLVHARRGHPLANPRRFDAARGFVTASEAWGRVREHWESGWSRRSGAAVDLEREASALLSAKTLAPSSDRVVLAAAERMLNGAATLVECVGARFGVAEAIAMKWRANGWNVTSGREQKKWWWMLADSKSPALLVDAGWRGLRDAACRTDDSDYNAARATAAALREAEKSPEARVRLDWVFPAEAEWAKTDLDAALVAPNFARVVHLILPLLASVADESAVLRAAASFPPYQALAAASYACDLVVALPEEDATRVLATLTERVLDARLRDQAQLHMLAVAMGAIRSEAMGRTLAQWLRHPRFGRWVATYFESDAAIASAALEPLTRNKNLVADAARAVLAANARAAEPDQGTMDDAPALLRDPPWRRAPAEPLALEMLAWNETITWAPGERERIAAAPPIASPNAIVRPITDAELAELDSLPPGQKFVDVWARWENKRWMMLELPEARTLALWDEGSARLYARPPCWMLARFGERALKGLFARDPFGQWDDERWVTALLRVDSPRSALMTARLYARRRIARKRAREWLLAHDEAAAAGLLPTVLGRESRSRRVALRAMRMLVHERPAVVDAIAARHGSAVHEATRALLFGDPLARLDARARPPRWLRIDSLPLLRTREGRPLPREAAKNLVDVLRGREQEAPYAGVEILRRELDLASFADFAWALFSVWTLHGAPRTHVWMARALDACPREDTAMRVRPLARELARTEPRACGVLVDLLAAIGDAPSRLVLTELETLAQAALLRQILAEARGENDEDALFDLDLDERGEATLDLGGRMVRVVVDESLAPRVVLDDGRRLAQMPRASKSDDPARVAAATARFNRLRRACATTARDEITRLERAMLAARRFRARDLAARWAHHAIASSLARRVVWGAFSGPELVATFRVAEDGSFADERDLPCELADDASIGVVHPIDLDAETRAQWATIFGDYEIVQPFEQLGRASFTGTAAEALAIAKALVGTMVDARSLVKTIETHGWQRTGRRIGVVTRQLRGTKPRLLAALAFTPGFDIGFAKKAVDQKITGLTVAAAPTFAEIDRIDLSELVRTATTLRA
ncbi:MAG TPA: DUF4132 domain-containing protein [Polyangiaceae bacterium]